MKKDTKISLSRIVLFFIMSSIIIFNPNGFVVKAESGAYETAKKSLVRMVAKFYSADGKMVAASLGTGFVIGDKNPVQYVVTNHHVIAPELGNMSSLKRKIFILLGRDDYIEIEEEAVVDLAETDIAVLKLKNPLSIEPVKVLTSENVKVTQEVYAMGFPGDADINGITGNMEDITVTNGTVSKIVNIQWMKGVKCYQTNAAVNSGNSGGPLVDKDGNVIGIVVSKNAAAEGIGIAIQIDELLPQLERRGIKYLKASATVKSEETPVMPETPITPVTKYSNKFMITGGIGILALLVAGSIIFIAMKKSSKNKKMDKNESRINVDPPNKDLSNYDTVSPQNIREANTVNIPNKYSAPPISNSSQVNEPVSLKIKIAKLYGLTGIYAGNEFVMEEDALVMGRDPRICQVVFPENAGEIGRKHCVVKYNKKDGNFVLEDCFSTNGTFVGSGEIMKPGISRVLKSGDRFYLSSTENLFEVRIE